MKKEQYSDLANNIITLIGGRDNISNLSHCITRLRFVLKDRSLADKEKLEALDGVLSVNITSSQYQIVIGPHVEKVYKEVVKQADLNIEEASANEEKEAKGIMSFFETISGCFMPMLPILIAGSLSKAIVSLLAAVGLPETSGLYIIMMGFGDAVLRFIPVLVGYGAAKKFGINPLYGVGLGIVFCVPGLQTEVLNAGEPIGTLLGVDYYHTLFGIPFITMDYQYTVIPIIAITFVTSKIYKIVDSKVHPLLKYSFVPLITMAISILIGFLVIGPMFQIVTQMLTMAVEALLHTSRILFGAVLGGCYLLMVMLGLHWCMNPISYAYYMEFGYTPTWAATEACPYVLLGITVALIVKSKNSNIRNTAIGAAFPMLISGVTEPALYGIVASNMKKILPILIPISALAGALFVSVVDGAYILGAEGVFGMLNYVNGQDMSGVMWYIIICFGSALLSFVVTLFVWKDEGEENVRKQSKR